MMILRRSRPSGAAPARSIAVALSCAAAFFSIPSARAVEPVPISWRNDYGGAFEEAKSTDRLLWIQFTGPWCPNCVRMERDSFPDADVIDHAQRSYVPVKLRSDTHESLALAFNLTGLPATVLIAPNREVLAVRQGYMGPDELDQLLGQSVAAWRGRELACAKPETPKADTPAESSKPALGGYCPVSLVVDRKLVAGKAEHSVEHDGKTYQFASAAMAERFRKEPERFIPANGGDCPVAQVDRGTAAAGQARWGILYEGRLFLCSSDEARKQFLAEPARYAMVDVAEQGFCPHCLGESGLLIRGDPQYAVTRDGRRYWFPDPTHRDAFLAGTRTSNASVATTVRR